MRLTRERLARGWSKAELARRAGLNSGTVGQIETGRLIPYSAQLTKLAKALGIPEANKAVLMSDAPVAPVAPESTERAPDNA